LRRCARNCSLCLFFKKTLIITPSDPPESSYGRISTISTLGGLPFFLYCSRCRWNSAEIWITFEKPTSLAGTYLLPSSTSMWYRTCPTKCGDPAPDNLGFERLKEHFDLPFLFSTRHQTLPVAWIPRDPLANCRYDMSVIIDATGKGEYYCLYLPPLTKAHTMSETRNGFVDGRYVALCYSLPQGHLNGDDIDESAHSIHRALCSQDWIWNARKTLSHRHAVRR